MAGGFEPLPLRLRANDPLSNWSAEDHARASADLTAAVPMMTKAKMRIKFVNSGNVITVEDYRGVLELDFISSTGSAHTIGIKNGGLDSYGKSGAFRIEHAHGCVIEGTATAPCYLALQLKGDGKILMRLNNPATNLTYTGDFEAMLYIG